MIRKLTPSIALTLNISSEFGGGSMLEEVLFDFLFRSLIMKG